LYIETYYPTRRTIAMGRSTEQHEATALSWGRRYLVCRPDRFDVVYSINPWMNTAVPVDRRRARRQWEALAAALEAAGADLQTLEPAAGVPDMVFTANAGLVVGDIFVPARMRHRQRRGERRHFERWFREHGYRVEPLAAGAVQEGAGDALPFAGRMVAGYRTRSSRDAYPELSRRLGAPVLPLELCDPRYYHLDLAFCPLGAGRAMVAPSALTMEGRARLGELVPEPLLLQPDEAASFCANSVVVGRTVIMAACPPRLRRLLERWDYEPVVVDVSEFIRAGGGVRCLTLALDVSPEAFGAEAATGSGGAGAAPTDPAIELAERHGARNYAPLPISISRAEGAWVYDRDGRAYLDALSAYSALNFGHRHPALVEAAKRQLDRVTLTSRAFHNDQLGPFCQELAELCGKHRVLPANTGAEAVESAIKVARKWGYRTKGVPQDAAKIVVCERNFHGRTVTIVSFSDDPLAREGFGPFTPGFVSVPYGDRQALAAALADPSVVAFLVEPIQGEAGVIVPPDGYLRAARELCSEQGVLMIADEIQSGLGRTGATFACDHEGVVPDVYVLGKALGGGLVPLSAVVADDAVLGILRPGEHGSTFGGNPLACAVGREVLRLLRTGEYQERSARLGARLLESIAGADLPAVSAVRGRGLWAGIDLGPDAPSARTVCERLLARGLLCKDTHERTIRLAPPLVVDDSEVDFALEALGQELGRSESRALQLQ
jgi:ornithine--oxo-acid transaminase